ncbi:histone-lysine N-methyltransferase SETMAR-like [Oratosquilla oratoria]|uniref:histone-lysine N-methyltransferase SETMAR-like n=1 Tax=Oratosquilla oratoria TaxID=337810 RepID=UPI003F765251
MDYRRLFFFEFENVSGAEVVTHEDNLTEVILQISPSIIKVDFNFKAEDQTGRPAEFDDELLVTSLEESSAVSVEELAIKLRSNHTTVHRHLQQLGKWLPYELCQVNRESRVDICLSLYSPECTTPFLDRLVTDNENLISYQKVKRRRQWLGYGKRRNPIQEGNFMKRRFFFKFSGIVKE